MYSCPRLLARSVLPRAGLTSPVVGFPVRNCRIWGLRRGLKTGAGVDKEVVEKLPLAGIRVLDMTRVLAGVRSFLTRGGMSMENELLLIVA